jgi:hypothetical protein
MVSFYAPLYPKPRLLHLTEMVFYPSIFRKIVGELKREASAPLMPPVVDPRDDDEETRKEERTKRLGILRNSTFLNLAVDNQVTWPPVETVVHFEGYRLILMPPTREHTTSIHIDLVGQQITSEKAVSLINRFLSLMTCRSTRSSRQLSRFYHSINLDRVFGTHSLCEHCGDWWGIKGQRFENHAPEKD